MISNNINQSKKKLLHALNIKTFFPIKKGFFQTTYNFKKVVDDISFELNYGETLGILGESGCGKSTLARTILRLIEPYSGQLLYFPQDTKDNNPIDFFKVISKNELLNFRRKFQLIFQDPNLSLNPKWKAWHIVEEPLVIHNVFKNKYDRYEYVLNLLERVGITKNMAEKYPHEFSGGQKQRIGIARALALKPELIIADEPVSALDVSVQAQVLNLLKELQDEYNLTYIFISHNLNVIKHISNKIMVLYMGRVMEIADTDTFFSNPYHPYSKLLKNSLLTLDEKSREKFLNESNNLNHQLNLENNCDFTISSIKNLNESGNFCYFYPRCNQRNEKCTKIKPELIEVEKNRYVACHNIK